MKYALGFFLLFLLGACAKSGPSTEIVLQLPNALAKGSARHRRFLERAISLELRWETKAGEKRTERFPPNVWESVQLPALDFPKSADDALTVHAQVWDNQNDGTPRAQPVLKGSGTLEAKEMDKEGRNRLRVKLSLQVAAGDYDG